MGCGMSQARGLFPISKATLRFAGITAMNTAMTNFLLALMVFRASKPQPPAKMFKEISGWVIEVVLDTTKRVGRLQKEELTELEELAEAHKKILKMAN